MFWILRRFLDIFLDFTSGEHCPVKLISIRLLQLFDNSGFIFRYDIPFKSQVEDAKSEPTENCATSEPLPANCDVNPDNSVPVKSETPGLKLKEDSDGYLINNDPKLCEVPSDRGVYCS